MVKSLIQERIFAEVPQVVPIIGYFSDEATVAEYNNLVDKDYQGLSALKPFRFDTDKGEVVGSNIPAKVLLFSKFLKPAGYEMSGLQDLEDAHSIHTMNASCGLDTSGYCYVDTGIVVRKHTERTADIVEQIRKRNPKLAELKVPVAFGLNGLEVRVEGKLNGVSYVLTDRTQLYEAPEYAGKNKLFSIVENGRPVIQEQGTRTVWNNDNLDISRFCLGSDLDVNADYDDLAYSGGYGRVVLHRGAAAGAKIFEDYTRKLNAEVEQAKSELESRYQNALQVLRGAQ